MRALLVTAALAAALALGGCADDAGSDSDDPLAGHPELLQVSDLPPVDSVEVSEQTNVSKTNCAAMDAEWNLAASKDFVYAWYELEGDSDTTVRSAVQGPAATSDAIDDTFTRLESMIAECVAGGASTGTFEPLEGLPDGAVGFVATQDTSNGTQTTERAYVKLDDQRAAVVTVVHTGDGEAPVSVTELLPKAVERASDA
ncbi:hypothetical protein GL325_10320 [Aeromicrobium sp. 636]|uniref:Sensor domain-containing protein n=1 Tax=Aeromicrobium senzhongii TaxID=2663859 RepID=A0A8I0EWQ1_9ACTN|nr:MULTISPECIES: hypothetical protein [Aeromicrobium]MBC9226721.1 hypothetical protein [Aeromicrobium senzhongii]MCQ3998821.1 hypothetical protein [Aeromicrobium sp. 636]